MEKKIKIPRNSGGRKRVSHFRRPLKVVANDQDETNTAEDERRYREKVMHYRE